MDGNACSRTDRSTTRRNVLRASAAAGTGLLAGCTGSAGSGRALTIGYQPFYTEAWSALVIKHAGLDEKYLPQGYSVDRWQVALQGAVVGNRMIAGKNQVGYTGDMPTITAIVNEKTPISAVGMAGYSQGLQCNLGVVPKGSDIDRVNDLDGKTFSLTTGACTHRFVLRMAERENLEYTIKDQGINAILTGIREGSIPVGFGWEPVIYKLVHQLDEAEYLLTGAPYGLYDAAGIIMPDSLLEEDGEAAKAWLKAELEATHIMATQPERTLDLVSQEKELSDFSRSTLRGCLYETPSVAPKDVDRLRFATDYEAAQPAARLLKKRAPQFLKAQGIIDRIPPGDRFAAKPLDTAVQELKPEVEWTVRRAGSE